MDNLVVSSLLLITVTSIFLNLLVFASDRCADIHNQNAGWSFTSKFQSILQNPSCAALGGLEFKCPTPPC